MNEIPKPRYEVHNYSGDKVISYQWNMGSAKREAVRVNGFVLVNGRLVFDARYQ